MTAAATTFVVLIALAIGEWTLVAIKAAEVLR